MSIAEHLYSHEQTREKLFSLLEEHILPGTNRNWDVGDGAVALASHHLKRCAILGFAPKRSYLLTPEDRLQSGGEPTRSKKKAWRAVARAL